MRRTCVVLSLLLAGANAPLAGQSSLQSTCDGQPVAVSGARDACLAAVQALVSAQPALGLVIAGGNPTLGTSGDAGLRLGVLPRISAGLRANVVGVRLPDIISDEFQGTVGDLGRRFGAPAPALIGDVAIGVTDGFGFAPGLGGIGGISLLASAAYLPFRALGVDGFEDSPDIAWGLGGRLHILQESFVVPGVSLSVMRRELATLDFGAVCPGTEVFAPGGLVAGQAVPFACTTEGDPGEVSFDLTDWSGRLVASKHLLGLGLTGGVGYDRYASDIGFGFRSPTSGPGGSTAAFRVTGVDLESTRWTLFGNASFSLLVATIAAEAGWQQGDAPITGFRDIQSAFDPADGTWFGSLGIRLSL